ncbi:MAG: 50S ribosomal protein L3 [Myxococcales bacterium]|nr:50S ribosomal protein L3 [Myxococcales bacterium]
MAIELLCRKLGMTQLFLDSGECVPVTVLEAAPNLVVDKKTMERDKYSALQLGVGDRKESRFGKAEAGHFKAHDLTPKALLRECRVTTEEAAGFEIGQEIDSSIFDEGQKVDVIGISKGRGFAGVVKRHGFKVKRRTHGTHEAFRHAGSIGAGSTPGHVVKGLPMCGHMGNARITTKNLTIVKIDAEKHLLYVRGGVPGHIDGYVSVRDALSGK